MSFARKKINNDDNDSERTLNLAIHYTALPKDEKQ